MSEQDQDPQKVVVSNQVRKVKSEVVSNFEKTKIITTATTKLKQNDTTSTDARPKKINKLGNLFE